MHENIIQNCFEEVIAAAVAGDRKFFLTLESRSNEDAWVQLRWDYINVAYQHDVEPLRLLATEGIALPAGVTLEAWEANKFATFEHSAEPLTELVAFVAAYLEKVFKLVPSQFTLRVRRDR